MTPPELAALAPELTPSQRLGVVLRRALRHWRPPRRMTLSEWADAHYYLSAESSADAGRWRTRPEQREIMNALTDPAVEQVTLMKSTRVGATKIANALVGYHIDQDPCSQMVVQPTIEDAEGYSKEEIAPMLESSPRLAEKVGAPRSKDSANTILHKRYPGGILSMVGANSGRGFRRVSRRILVADEIDEYPRNVAGQGDPITLAKRRTETFWNRKLFFPSTPRVAGASRIEAEFLAGDQRRYHVPCPNPDCGHFDFLKFRESTGPGHYLKWPKGEPEKAFFVCSKNGCVIEHQHKRDMLEKGRWVAEQPFKGHASFHIWAAYSVSANATWGQIAREFIDSEKDVDKLCSFVNTMLGETWQERGDAPDWKRLFERRAMYPIGSVPEGVVFLTAGVDVQKDRLVYEVVGWGASRQSWSIEAAVLPGDTASVEVWSKLDEVLAHKWSNGHGVEFGILMLAIDSGYNTQEVYNWARRHPMSRVIATKGVATSSVLLNSPTKVDVTPRGGGKKLRRGYKVWTVGVNIAKAELYGWLRQEPPAEGQPWPQGFCHFPHYGEDYFQQLTAEHLVPIKKRSGHPAFEWQVIAGRENHFLDCRILARAAASLAGLDRLDAKSRTKVRRATKAADAAPAPVAPPATSTAPEVPRPLSPPAEAAPALEQRPKRYAAEEKKQSWLGGRGAGSRGSWLNKRR